MSSTEFEPQDAFVQLHGQLAHEPQLASMRAEGVAFGRILNLYPLEPLTYLPHFRARFATRARLRDESYFVPHPSVMGIDSLLDSVAPDDETYWSDVSLGEAVIGLIEIGIKPGQSSWQADQQRSSLRFEVTSTMALMTKLLRFNMTAYHLLPRRKRAELRKELNGLPHLFEAYETGVDRTRQPR